MYYIYIFYPASLRNFLYFFRYLFFARSRIPLPNNPAQRITFPYRIIRTAAFLLFFALRLSALYSAPRQPAVFLPFPARRTRMCFTSFTLIFIRLFRLPAAG